MHVFVTGGTGLTGPAVVSGLITAGHSVTGLARSNASAARLEALGAAVLRGSLGDLDVLRAGPSSRMGRSTWPSAVTSPIPMVLPASTAPPSRLWATVSSEQTSRSS